MTYRVVLGFALLASGCQESTESCGGADCEGDCTLVGECVAAGTAFDLRLTWTLGGVAPTPSDPAPCDGVASLSVELDGGGPSFTFEPVTCNLGILTLLGLPPRFELVTLSAVGEGGSVLGQAASEIPSGLDITVDLALP